MKKFIYQINFEVKNDDIDPIDRPCNRVTVVCATDKDISDRHRRIVYRRAYVRIRRRYPARNGWRILGICIMDKQEVEK